MSCYTTAERDEQCTSDEINASRMQNEIDASHDNLARECMRNLTCSTKNTSCTRVADYDEELADWMQEQEEKMREQEEEELIVPIKSRNHVSLDTSFARQKKNRKARAEAQLFVTGTLDKSKKNKKYNKKYSTYSASRKDADQLPDYARTLSERRAHRKRDIDRARLLKIDANTAGPTPSEESEMKDIEAEQDANFWYNAYMEEVRQANEMQERQHGRKFPYTYELDWDSDSYENRRVGDMLGSEHLANVNSCSYY